MDYCYPWPRQPACHSGLARPWDGREWPRAKCARQDRWPTPYWGPCALTRLSRLGIRPLLLGVLLCTLGLSMYLFGVVMAVPRRLLGASALLPFNEWIVWYSGMPLMAGLLLSAADLFILLSIKRSPLPGVRYDPVSPRVVVALTAYNDELSIAAAVADFRAHPLVDEVIVVSNNSQGGTLAAAAAAATAVNEGAGRRWWCFVKAIVRFVHMTSTS